ncbi:hypothetical protein IAR55_003380 [Kwoniella newhampshirensis]|uniref:Mitochondrial K+-H+ exchange-related-domain-containing protein n=1 Tax=Kwoniella newhampshirensis TaxID=1651941 RepID=A0AAW0YYZ4_9TREE
MASKIPTKTTRSFRIFALPLARLPRSTPDASSSNPTSTSTGTESKPKPASAKTPLLLFHVSQPDPTPDSAPPNLINKGLAKASDTWLKLGEKDKNSWTYWFYARGEKLMDKIEYEEWALKAVKEGEGVRISKEGQVLDRIEIPLLRPTLKEPLPPLLPKLHRLLLHRIPYHRKMMYRTIIASPLTWPFAIIPVIPNFPLFYVLWRAWSHYKAWRGAQYLETLLKSGLIVEKENEQLGEIYAAKGKNEGANRAPDETSSSAESLKGTGGDKQDLKGASAKSLAPQAKGLGAAPDGTATPSSLVYRSTSPSSDPSIKTSKPDTGTNEQPAPAPAPGPITSTAQHPSLLLSPSQIPLLAKTFNLRPYEVMDITRAIEQADFRARRNDSEREIREKAEEKADEERKDKEGKAE